MTQHWLFAADFIDALANRHRSAAAHEEAAARASTLAAHGAELDLSPLAALAPADLGLASSDVWRWALDAAKTVDGRSRAACPPEAAIDALYQEQSEFLSRLLVAEAALTHPAVEAQLEPFARVLRDGPAVGVAIPTLEGFPDVWPSRSLLRRFALARDGDDLAGFDAFVTELGVIALQIGSAGSLALVGAIRRTMRRTFGARRFGLDEEVARALAEQPRDGALRALIDPGG